jgi:hypothetical protein
MNLRGICRVAGDRGKQFEINQDQHRAGDYVIKANSAYPFRSDARAGRGEFVTYWSWQ